MRANYEEFRKYLQNIKEDRIQLSIEEIEKIIGAKLCNSSYKYLEWWSGVSHPLSKIWIEEGMIREKLELGEYLILSKKNTEKIKINISNQEENASVEELKKVGFKCVGEWKIQNNKISLDLKDMKNQSNVLYSFVVNKNIKYIGKTTKPLLKRMRWYENPGVTQTTNIRNNSNIKRALESEQKVQIFCFKGSFSLKYEGYKVNLAAGLEDSLIKRLSPEWNITGR